MSAIVPLIIVCAALLIFGGTLLLIAVVAMWFMLRGSDTSDGAPVSYERSSGGSMPNFRSPPTPPPVPGRLENNHVQLDDDDAAKTEVFMRRGSMNLDWDDDGGEDATELFSPEIHGMGELE